MKRWRDARARKGGTFVFINGRSPNVHAGEQCEGRACCLHNPSEHSMRDWPMLLRETGLVERVCVHGVGHPDPDSVRYFDSVTSGGWGVHGCDGCCRGGEDK